MDKICFLADTPCDLTLEQIKGKPITIIPTSIHINGVIKKDVFEVNREDYWKLLKDSNAELSTSMAPPDLWLEAYENALKSGYTHVICLCVSNSASSVTQVANIAKDIFLGDHPNALTIEIVDSRAYTVIYGRMLLECAELVEKGASFDEVLKALKKKIACACAVVWVYSLKQMKKSGRISGMSAFVGEALGVRPILLAKDGFIGPIDKIRGEKNLIPKAVEHTKKLIKNPSEQIVYLLYTDNPEEEIQAAENQIIDAMHPKAVVRHPIGSAVTTNCGSETMGFVFYGAEFVPEESDWFKNHQL